MFKEEKTKDHKLELLSSKNYLNAIIILVNIKKDHNKVIISDEPLKLHKRTLLRFLSGELYNHQCAFLLIKTSSFQKINKSEIHTPQKRIIIMN